MRIVIATLGARVAAELDVAALGRIHVEPHSCSVARPTTSDATHARASGHSRHGCVDDYRNVVVGLTVANRSHREHPGAAWAFHANFSSVSTTLGHVARTFESRHGRASSDACDPQTGNVGADPGQVTSLSPPSAPLHLWVVV